MTQNAWQNADTNIQYRILNALIKENIWQEQTIITTKDDQLDIQYHGCILSTHFNHNSVMSRYEFGTNYISMWHKHNGSINSRSFIRYVK